MPVDPPVPSPPVDSLSVMRRFRLALLPQRLAVCRLAPDAPIPQWASGSFVAITRTPRELSIVCDESAVPDGVRRATGFRAFEVAGPLDFSEVGVLASLAQPLADAGVSLFAISTFDTDYVLVREADVDRAAKALAAAGHLGV